MKNQKTVSMVMIALFAALIAVCAVIAVPLPLTPVPVSLLTLGLFLTGGLLSPKAAPAAAAIHLLLGAVGVPVFSGLRGGVGVLLGPTGGYLLAGPVMVFLIAWLSSLVSSGKGRIPILIGSMVAGLIVCYLAGTAWYCVQLKTSFWQGYLLCVQPFLFADACKLIVAIPVVLGVRHALNRQKLRTA